jgi:hypothetical protein
MGEHNQFVNRQVKEGLSRHLSVFILIKDIGKLGVAQSCEGFNDFGYLPYLFLIDALSAEFFLTLRLQMMGIGDFFYHKY